MVNEMSYEEDLQHLIDIIDDFRVRISPPTTRLTNPESIVELLKWKTLMGETHVLDIEGRRYQGNVMVFIKLLRQQFDELSNLVNKWIEKIKALGEFND